ncbi:T9SS type A sorting domain-containing protein [Bacteroides sp.]|uniref:T9SS type A sorting domain-containing protein n=1 Tax=Bacteroides sp. TaxID=29523 RepID=UPI0025C6F2EF|nr:T9SS type A sorting domain-containing protein [Bacteroides sp.]
MANSTISLKNVVIDYSQLVKNAKVKLGDGSGTEIVTRTVAKGPEATTTESIASLIVDVIGEECADRLWIFSKQSSTHGFDNGWDGRKMLEENIAQLFVAASDSSQLQVATVPAINKVVLGFIPEMDGKYTLDFAPSAHLKGMDIYLHDTKTGTTHRVSKEQSYSFDAKRGDAVNRFSVSYAANNSVLSEDEVLIDVNATNEGEISIVNGSSNTCTALVSDGSGKLLQRIEVKGKSEAVIKDIAKGVYMIRLQNAGLNDVRRVVVK